MHSGLQNRCRDGKEGLQKLVVEEAAYVASHRARPILAARPLRDPREHIHCQRAELLCEPLSFVVLQVDLQQVHPELYLHPAGILIPRHD